MCMSRASRQLFILLLTILAAMLLITTTRAQLDEDGNIDLGFAQQQQDHKMLYENFDDYKDPTKVADIACQTCQSMVRYLSQQCPIYVPPSGPDSRTGTNLNEKHLRFQQITKVGMAIDSVCDSKNFVDTDYPPPVIAKSCEKIRDSDDVLDRFEEIFSFRSATNTEKVVRGVICEKELKLCSSLWEDDLEKASKKEL